jgi:hypothetical protein
MPAVPSVTYGVSNNVALHLPFLGPGDASRSIFVANHITNSRTVIGPIVGDFVVENPHLNWRFNFWLMFIFSAMSLITGYFCTPEKVSKMISFF